MAFFCHLFQAWLHGGIPVDFIRHMAFAEQAKDRGIQVTVESGSIRDHRVSLFPSLHRSGYGHHRAARPGRWSENS